MGHDVKRAELALRRRRIDLEPCSRHGAGMSTILEADATGTLHLPPSLLPHPGPGRRYRVAAEGGQVIVDEASVVLPDSENREVWLQELERRRARGAMGKEGTPLQEILDDIRGD